MEYTRGIDSRFPVSFLADKIKERGIKDKKTKKNAYQMEYMVSLKISSSGSLGHRQTPTA
jgi:hypothetical protein